MNNKKPFMELMIVHMPREHPAIDPIIHAPVSIPNLMQTITISRLSKYKGPPVCHQSTVIPSSLLDTVSGIQIALSAHSAC
jgi:hypothetical protein